MATEFNHIKDWATRNHLKINTKKTKEIVLRKPRELAIFICLCFLTVLRVSTVFFYRVMHVVLAMVLARYAGIAIVSRPCVRPSVCPSVCKVHVP